MNLPNSVSELVALMKAGNRVALARLISKIEYRNEETRAIIEALFFSTGTAQVWGVTGPPGAGKSTIVDRIVFHLRKQQKKVAVVCIDPSSPFSGGAILGDRIRMQQHSMDPGVYIRSLGTRGRHGGLSHSTKEVVFALDAAQFDVILVETAGVGQTELDILKLAHTVVVALVPESGDSIQVMKAGLMEIADVFVVNKSDRPEADKLVRELTQMVGLGAHDEHSWMMPVCKTEAIRDAGIPELVEQILKHQDYLQKSGKKGEKDRLFLREELVDILIEDLVRSVDASLKTDSGKEVLMQLQKKLMTPYEAAKVIAGQ